MEDIKKNKASASKMGRGREDERGTFPGQSAKIITERFALGIACAILILSGIHLPFQVVQYLWGLLHFKLK